MDPASFAHVLQFSQEEIKQSDFSLEDIKTVTSEEISLQELEEMLAARIIKTKALSSIEISTTDVTQAQSSRLSEEESESPYFSEITNQEKFTNYFRKNDMMPCLSSTN